jgi:P-type Ca2+ transporter type 2C
MKMNNNEKNRFSGTQPPVRAAWSLEVDRVLEALDSSTEGLPHSKVLSVRKQYGPNSIRQQKNRPAWRIFVDQGKNLIAAMLVAAAVASFIFGHWLDGASVLVALGLNVLIGFFTELRAVRSMEALSRLGQAKVTVRRGGKRDKVPAAQLVPGDVVLLEAGDVVPADLRLIRASRAEIDESTLTGESVPVGKSLAPVDVDAPLAERQSMLFKGTVLSQGDAEGVVTATGMQTELGRIAELAEEAEDEQTPLERRLEGLGQKLIWVTLGLSMVVAIAGFIGGRDLLLIVKTTVALAVAAIPEGLPIVATLALARGMWRLSRRNALIRRLSAVETLGATSVICTDKTGTLTENRMTVTRLLLPSPREHAGELTVDKDSPERPFNRDGHAAGPDSDTALERLLEVAALCNSVDHDGEGDGDGARRKLGGDPMEVALFELAELGARGRKDLLESMPEKRREAFDPDIMMMATVHRRAGELAALVKGAPEAVLHACTRARTGDDTRDLSGEEVSWWLERNKELAGQGLRLLAAAERTLPTSEASPYEDMTFLGLFCFRDPPRQTAARAVSACKDAGVKVVMVTGDQAGTAKSIGVEMGLASEDDVPIQGKDIYDLEHGDEESRQRLLDSTIFCRVAPEQKLDLVDAFQKAGAVTAMTGDGVNDAPALKKADIGVAMGQRGTQAARDAADMVLKDDHFESIVAAMEQGRGIFENIRKFILYLLSGNTGEIMIVAAALLMGLPLPLLPLQILYLNMLSDVFPALALGIGESDPSLMHKPPRDASEPILTRGHWIAVVAYGALIAATVLTSFGLALYVLELPQAAATTASFLTLAFARQWHVLNMRDKGTTILDNAVIRNKWVWAAVILCFLLLAAAVYVPPLALALKLEIPSARTWGLIVGMSLIPLLVGQLSFAFRRKGN